MPQYEVTSPKGKKIIVEGDAPPQEADLDQIFRDADSYQGEQPLLGQAPKEESTEALELSGKDYKEREAAMNPIEKAGAKVLRGAQFVGGMLPAAWSSVSTTPLTEYAIQRLEKKVPEQAKEEAAGAAATDLAASIATAGLPIIGGFAKAGGKAGFKALFKGGAKTAGKELAEAGGKKIIGEGVEAVGKKGVQRKVAQQIGDKMGLQSSSIEALENPYIRQNFAKIGAHNAEQLAPVGANSLKALHKDFPEIASQFYAKKGITDDTIVPAKKALVSIQDFINKESKGAITPQRAAAIKDAKYTLAALKKSADKNGNMTFGTLKTHTKNLWDDASGAYESGNYSAGKTYSNIRKELTAARDDLPQIKKASEEFKGLKDTEDSLENAFKMGKDPDEINLERKILRRTKDKGNEEFRNQMEKIDTWVKNTPEAAAHTHAIDNVKLAHIANDVESAKAISPGTSKRWLPIAALKNLPGASPHDKLRSLKFLAEHGGIKKGSLTDTFKYSDMPIIGNFINAGRARKAMYGGVGPIGRGLVKGGSQYVRGNEQDLRNKAYETLGGY